MTKSRMWIVAILFVIFCGCQRGVDTAPPTLQGRSKRQPGPKIEHATADGSGSKTGDAPGSRGVAGPNISEINRVIELAENFVRNNGYTDFRPDEPDKLVPEAIEREGRDEWAANRRDSLKPRARGYFRGARRDPDGWTVGFEYVNPRKPNLGRAVTMDSRGGSVRMQHVDLILERLLPRPD